MFSILKKVAIGLFGLVVILALLIWSAGYLFRIEPPRVGQSQLRTEDSLHISKNVSRYGNNFFQHREAGIWEMYLEGNGYELGYANGILTQKLVEEQEVFFVNELNTKVPSKIYQSFLKAIITFFNRNLADYIPLEYQQEIFGVSQFASPKYNYIAPAYERILNYHAAHDIGHALQNMHLVACTALGAWGEYTTDSTMYVGRNFDFYVGDDFAKNKIIAFVQPDTGYAFMSVTWGGMIGVVSGMNNQGLTITLNADKSEIPPHSGTPVSIIARKILQYASTIDEAYTIANSYQSFVSESFMIASAVDKKIAIIEKTPAKTSLYYPNDSQIICANHFQSDSLKNIASNTEHIADSTSYQRQLRVKQLMSQNATFDEKVIAKILRDKEGLNNEKIGLGNPKAINQLIAHHSIIFNPYKKEVWVSTAPFQLGKYIYYNLDSIFSTKKITKYESNNIPADPFIKSTEYASFNAFKKSMALLQADLSHNQSITLSEQEVEDFLKLNPNYFETYRIIGDYYFEQKNYLDAQKMYQKALTLDMPSETDRVNLQQKLSKIDNKKL